MVSLTVSTGSDQSNVTGASAVYEIDWNGSINDPYGVWSSNQLNLNSKAFLQINTYLMFGGMSALNSEVDLILNTYDGDILIYCGNPTNGLVSSAYNLCVSRLIVVNPNNTTGYWLNLKVKVNGGVGNSVDILTGSCLAFSF